MELLQFKDTPVRMILRGEDPWWNAADVCRVLGLKNPGTSLALLDDDEKGIHSMDTLGGAQEMTVINEPGLYSLIFRSRKAEAKEFKRWVTHEVLPSIRKTGMYATPQTIRSLDFKKLDALLCRGISPNLAAEIVYGPRLKHGRLLAEIQNPNPIFNHLRLLSGQWMLTSNLFKK